MGDGQTDIDLGHEGRGARWLASVFPPAVTGPIALHVAAKRYRCAVDPGYHDGLSDGSRRSLVRQGGPMAADEVERFAAHPAHEDAVDLRGWDDGGKVLDLEVPSEQEGTRLLAALGIGPDKRRVDDTPDPKTCRCAHKTAHAVPRISMF